MKYCKYCGGELHTDAVFCKYCGGQQSTRQGRKKSGKKKLITAVIAFVLVAALVITTFWRPGFLWKYINRNVAGNLTTSALNFSTDESDMLFKDAEEDPELKKDAEDYTPYSTGSAITWTQQEIDAGKEYSAGVAPDSAVADLAGVTVDLGQCNLTDQATLTVRIPESKSSAAEFCRNATLYDFSLTANSEDSGNTAIQGFAEPVRVEIPYTAAGDSFPMVRYYDMENDSWETVPADRTEKGIEFYVTHFSPYVVFDYEIPQYDRLSPDIKINLDAYKLIEEAKTKDYQKAFLEYVQGDPSEIEQQFLDTVSEDANTCVSIGGLPVSLADFMLNTRFTKWSGNALGGIGVICTTYLVTREIWATKSIPEALQVLLKRGLDIGAALSTSVSIGAGIAAKSSLVSTAAAATLSTVAAAASVAAIFFTIAGLMNTIHQMQMSAIYGGYEDGTELAYRTFNQKLSFDPYTGQFRIWLNHHEHTKLEYWSNYRISLKSVCFEDVSGRYYTGALYNMPPSGRIYADSAASWAPVMEYCKKTYGLENAIKNFEKFVDVYCQFFWTQPMAVKNTFFKFGFHEVPGNGRTAELYQEPFSNASYVRRQKDQIMKTCEPLIEGVMKEMVIDIRRKTHESVQRYVNEVNKEITFVLEYTDEKGNPLTLADSPYKDNYIVIGIDNTRWDRSGTPAWVVNMDQQKLFSCTFGAYTLSQPKEQGLDQLQVYKNEKAYLKGDAPIAVIPFTFDMPKTTVRLKADDIFGTWNINTDVGEFGSEMTDQQISAYIESMRKLAAQGAAGVDMGDVEEYLKTYEESMRKALGNHSGTMTITDAGGGKITAVITYSDAADHPSRYTGTYDPQSRKVKLTNDDKQALDPGLSFTIESGPPLHFTTTVSFDSQIANYEYTLSGEKAQ